MRVVSAIVLLLVLAGCTVPVVPPATTPHLEVLEEDQGWVQVRVTGVPSLGYTLRWGDVETSYGVPDVHRWQEIYEHFYQAIEGERSGEQIPAEYTIELVDDDGHVLAQEAVWIASVVCHLALVGIDGRRVTVQYWGRFGIEYSISWGDHYADHVWVSTQNASGQASHTYGAAGTYTLGMEEIWAPRQTFFTITVE